MSPPKDVQQNDRVLQTAEGPLTELCRFQEASSGQSDGSVDRPFHIFTKKGKWKLVGIIGVVGLCSGMSANIYFPALYAITQVCFPPPSLPLHVRSNPA